MTGIVVAVGFVGMVLAPCAIAIYSKLGHTAEHEANDEVHVTPEPVASSPARLAESKAVSESVIMRPVPLPAPVRVVSLREAAERAMNEARQAQIVAAHAYAEALTAASRLATERAAAAAKLSDAAEKELVRATQAAMQAEALKAKARSAENLACEQDYLPHNHPSLDFPRSRVPSSRVA